MKAETQQKGNILQVNVRLLSITTFIQTSCPSRATPPPTPTRHTTATGTRHSKAHSAGTLRLARAGGRHTDLVRGAAGAKQLAAGTAVVTAQKNTKLSIA